jgi:hypothetical protein
MRISARAVPDVTGAIAATRLTNPHTRSRELIIVFVNFVSLVFIVVISFFIGL